MAKQFNDWSPAEYLIYQSIVNGVEANFLLLDESEKSIYRDKDKRYSDLNDVEKDKIKTHVDTFKNTSKLEYNDFECLEGNGNCSACTKIIVSSIFLETILDSPFWPMNFTHKGIRIRGVCLKNKLDLGHISFKHRLEIKESYFKEEVYLIEFQTSHFLSFKGSHFADGIDAHGLRSGHSVNFSECVFKASNHDKEAHFDGARIGRTLDFTYAKFSTRLSMEKATINNHLQLRGATFEKEADFSFSVIDGGVQLSRSTINANLDLSNLEVRKDLILGAVETASKDTYLPDKWNLPGKRGREPKEDREKRDVPPTYNGSVMISLKNSHVGRLQDFENSWPDKDGGNADAFRKFDILRLFYILWAKVFGLKNDTATLDKWYSYIPYLASIIYILGSYYLYNQQAQEIREFFSALGGKGMALNIIAMLASAACILYALSSLMHLKITKKGNNKPLLDLRGFTFDRLGGLVQDRSKRTTREDIYWRKKWLEKHHPYSPHPYIELAKSLAAKGHQDLAYDILYAGKKREYRKAVEENSQGIAWYFKSFLHKIFIGYGYRNHRAIGWALSFTVAGTVFIGAFADENSKNCFRHIANADDMDIFRCEPQESKTKNQERSVILEKLPDGVSFSGRFTDKISWNEDKKLRIYVGVMSSKDKDMLLKLSKDSLFQQAIESLYSYGNPDLPRWVNSGATLLWEWRHVEFVMKGASKAVNRLVSGFHNICDSWRQWGYAAFLYSLDMIVPVDLDLRHKMNISFESYFLRTWFHIQEIMGWILAGVFAAGVAGMTRKD